MSIFCLLLPVDALEHVLHGYGELSVLISNFIFRRLLDDYVGHGSVVLHVRAIGLVPAAERSTYGGAVQQCVTTGRDHTTIGLLSHQCAPASGAKRLWQYFGIGVPVFID